VHGTMAVCSSNELPDEAVPHCRHSLAGQQEGAKSSALALCSAGAFSELMCNVSVCMVLCSTDPEGMCFAAGNAGQGGGRACYHDRGLKMVSSQ
jgi:hypothetical protein